MTTVTISPRMKTLMHRFFDIYYEKALAYPKCHALEDEGEVESRKFRIQDQIFIEVSYVAIQPLHEDDCEIDGEDMTDTRTSEDQTCDCDKNWQFNANIDLKGETGKHYCGVDVFHFTQNTEKSRLFDWLAKIETNFKLCSCGYRVKRDNWCADCFIHRYERTEEEGGDCCICLQNEGVWVKILPCNHILHLHCRLKIPGWNCPLCRQEMKGFEVNPYNI
jgi:hypothetical protein